MESTSTPVQTLAQISGGNFPRDADGRVYHLAIKAGDVANRILTVGDHKRAKKFSEFLEGPIHVIIAPRGFSIYTGRFRGVPLSIIGIGMGYPMMDFMIREVRDVVRGKMVIIRFGTCGTPNPEITVGSIVVSSTRALGILRNPSAFYPAVPLEKNSRCCFIVPERNSENAGPASVPAADLSAFLTRPYTVHHPAYPDATLSSILVKSLKGTEGLSEFVFEGDAASADSFYCSQGRPGSEFIVDNNETLIDEIMETYPRLSSLEMETYHLFHMANSSNGTIASAAAALVLADRVRDKFVPKDVAETRILQCIVPVLESLASYELSESETMSGPECSWNVSDKQ